MVILALALYDCQGSEKKDFEKRCAAQQDKSFRADSQLEKLENYSLPTVIKRLKEAKSSQTYFYITIAAEHHYFKAVDKDPEKIMAIVSRSTMNIIERRRLFERIEASYRQEKALKKLLEAMVDDFLPFINKDLALEAAQQKAEEIKLDLHKSLQQAGANLDMMKDLEEKAENLKDLSKTFKKGSEKLNSGCCRW